jgi:DNA-binding MarR family transcriptional regulator
VLAPFVERVRRRTDRVYPRSLGPRKLEALRLVEQRPGITVEELAEEIGVTLQRAWQYVRRLAAGRVRRES